MDGLKTAETYQDFDTDSYYAIYRTDQNKDADGVRQCNEFLLDSLHSIFSTGNVKGQRLLDVGTGASLLSFMSASLYVEEIHLSDFLQNHVVLLQKWLDGEDIDKDLVQYLFEKENNKYGRTSNLRLSDLRSKIKSIKHIDVNKIDPLEGPPMTFDIITSSFCLEVATKNVTEFRNALANISSLLVSGGHIVLCGTLNEDHYIVGNYKFWNANISKDDLYTALDATGHTIKFWRELSMDENRAEDYMKAIADFKLMFVIAAQKR